MFSKKSAFNLHTPKSKHKTSEQKREIDFTSQLIICGSLTDEFLAGINGGKFECNEEERYTALLFSLKGELTIRAEINLDSDINYTESRKKNKKKDMEYRHEDNLKKQINSSSATSSYYTITTADFHSQNNNWIVVAAKDTQERDSIIKEITPLINHARFKVCIFLLPDLIEGNHTNWSECSMPVDFNPSHISISHIRSKKDLVGEGKNFENKLTKDAKEYMKSLEDGMVENLKSEALQEIEKEIHQEADQFFAEHEKKCIMM